jgi:type VI secretion system secreted protein VgrG
MVKDFDYQKPKSPLVSALPSTASPDFHVEGEFYDYPGNYLDTDAGNRLVGLRLQQAQSFYETFEASGPVRGIGVGNVFGLEGPLALQTDREYLIIKAHYEIHGHIPDSSSAVDKDESFTCSITAVDSKIPFRPARLTPSPIVQGPQTATVVGPKKDDPGKDEIWTDDLGRVLVKFHWERRGSLKPQDKERDDEDKDNELAPCWLRVAQLWAGAGWGTVFIPRIGQEVMVEFLEGDPDRPIVTGRLYNGDNKPAYLGENKATQSGIRTRSSPEGSPKNFNEIRFDDKKGSEELYIQAEKDHKSHVKHNRSADVGASDSISVGGDRSLQVSGNLSVKVDGGGKSEHHSDHTVKGKYNLYASDTIDIGAKNQITLTVQNTYIKITKDTITLHAVDGGEVIVTANVDAHSSGKSSLLLDDNAKLTGKTNATITGQTLLAHGDQTARIEGKAMTAHADETGTVEAKDLVLTGKTSVAMDGGGAKIDVTGSGIDAHGTEIKLNG